MDLPPPRRHPLDTIAEPMPQGTLRVSRARRATLAAVAALVGLFTGFVTFSIPALVMGWFVGGPEQIHRELVPIKPRISPILAGITALAAIRLGAASVVFPAYASSLGMLWGTMAVLGGVAFIAAAEWQFRSDRAERSR